MPFYRVASSGHGSHGTGLGLAVARGFVVAHSGRIWAENRPTGGARFAFALPLSSTLAFRAPATGRRLFDVPPSRACYQERL